MLSNSSWSTRTNSQNNNNNPSSRTASMQQQYQQQRPTTNAAPSIPSSSTLATPIRASLSSSSSMHNTPVSSSVAAASNTKNHQDNINNNNNNFALPMLSDLLNAVGSSVNRSVNNVDQNLFNLLSGIVASVEVTNERVVEMSEQYQELSLEVATISRVIQSNQLQANNTNNNNTQQNTTMNHNSNNSTVRRIGAVQSQRPSSLNITTNTKNNHTTNNNQSIASLVTENNSNMYLATESVSALHSHAVADLESKIDNLALRIHKLQEEVSVRAKEALDQGITEVLHVCDTERGATEEFFRTTAAQIEGQMTVRVAEAFAEREAHLNSVAQSAFDKIKECSEELVISIGQTSKGFIENASATVSKCVEHATNACANIIMESRETALAAAHDATIKTYETESRMLSLYQNFEQLVQSYSYSSSTTNPSAAAKIALAPLPFRCCSAVDEVRALYNLLQIDGAEALRIFKEHILLSTSSTHNNSNQIFNGKSNLAQIRGGFTRNALDGLSICLRTPMLRCLEPLPSLGLQVADAPAPTEGAEVVFIKDGGRSHLAGLRVGDIILRVDGRELGVGAASRGGLHLALLTAPNRPLPSGVRTVLNAVTSASKGDDHESTANNNSNSSSTTRWLPQVPKQSYSSASLVTSSINNNNSNSSGVKLTVYRFKDALTFTCTLNLDPLL